MDENLEKLNIALTNLKKFDDYFGFLKLGNKSVLSDRFD
jgi:hypothetical protein